MIFTLVLPQPRRTEHLAHIRLPCIIKEWESVESELRNSSGKEFNEGGLQVSRRLKPCEGLKSFWGRSV